MWNDSAGPVAEKLKAKAYKKAFITTHHKPDGDAMGSSLGLAAFLRMHIPDVQVITPTDYPENLHFLPGNDAVIDFEARPETALEHLEASDVIFCLDFNSLKRINELGEAVAKSPATKVLFDHHLDPEGFEDHAFWNPKISSTCELIYLFIKKYFALEDITPDMAACLYTGLMTDTGNFAYANTNEFTHIAAADLLKTGIVHADIHAAIYDNFTLNRTRLFGYCLHEKMEILPGLNTALIYLDREELQRFEVKTGDTEGLVNFGLGLKNIRLSVLIIDRTKVVKMSFRSKGDIAVNEYAAKYFGGGGHKNAAGGFSNDTLEATVQKFRDTIKEYKRELTGNEPYKK